MPGNEKSAMSLRARVLLLITLVFVVFGGLVVLKAVDVFDGIKREKQTEFKWAARWIESNQHRHLAQARLVAFLAMNEMRKGFARDEVCKYGVSGFPGLDPEFGHFAIAEPDGTVHCNSIPWLAERNVSGEKFFREAVQSIDISVFAEANNRQPDRYEGIMARAMFDRHGHVLKVILVQMDFSWVHEEVNIPRLPAGGHLMVVDPHGILIAGSRNLSAWIDKSIADLPYYKRAKMAHDASYSGTGFAGKDSLVVSREFESTSGTMHVIIDVPFATLLAPAYRNLAGTLLGSLLIYALLMVTVYLLSNKYFLQKVTAIGRTATALADGDLSARTGLGDGDELGHLAQSFDAMADRLQTNEEQLKSTNDELYRVNRALRVLSAGNKSLLLAKTEQELLARVCRDIVEEGGYLAAWIGFAGPKYDEYLHPAASYSRAESESDRLDWNRGDNGVKPVINSMRKDEVLIINDTAHESVHKHLGEQASRFGYRSIVVLPLHLQREPLGVLILTAYRTNEFGELQVEYLKETASEISFGIEMLRTRSERDRLALLGERHEVMIREGLEDALRAISRTIEMRDPYTAGHQRRVADLALALARELGLSNDECHGIYLAAIVHDIGKINVPAEILVKPGRLNEMEYTLVKNHVTASYEILKDIKFPWPVADIVHQHHERLDGSGYPLGLKNGDILFGGRILAVADVVEAMSSHRPYRPGLGVEVALNEIEKGRGVLYDAAVADACLKLFREGRFQFG